MTMPVTMLMKRSAFLLWLHEVKGCPEGDDWKRPDFRFDDECGPEYPYSKVEGYIGTLEGTVIAHHMHDGDEVRVTFGGAGPGEELVSMVRRMAEASRGDLGRAA